MDTVRRHCRPHLGPRCRPGFRPGFVVGPGASIAWLMLALYLIVALIQIAMNFSRLSSFGIGALLLFPIVIAAVVGLVCWLLGRAILYRNTIAGAVGWSVVLLIATIGRVLFMSGVMTGSMQGGNLRVNTPGEAASNTPAPAGPTRPTPLPVMPNPAQPGTPSAGAGPGAPPATRNSPVTRPPRGPARDFAAVAEQVAATESGAREVLTRHAHELQSLIDGFASPAQNFLVVLEAPASVDPSVLRQRIETVQTMKEAGTRYNTAAKSLRERLESDLRAEPRVNKDAIPSISGRFIALSAATGRIFAIEQAIRAGDDLTRQAQLILDSPSGWSVDASGQITSTDMSKATEYRLLDAALMGPRRMIPGAVERAITP